MSFTNTFSNLIFLAAAILVVIEVVVNSVTYEEQFLTDRHPKGAVWSYGYSFIIALLNIVILVICGLTFMICSRKRKGDRGIGLQSGDDEPHILGRMWSTLTKIQCAIIIPVSLWRSVSVQRSLLLVLLNIENKSVLARVGEKFPGTYFLPEYTVLKNGVTGEFMLRFFWRCCYSRKEVLKW